MSRRLRLPTVEMGDLDLFVVYATNGDWEASWAPLQGSEMASLLPVVSLGDYGHALAGWTSPLVRSLGLPPEGALRKLPLAGRTCVEWAKCPLRGKSCHPLDKRMPWCFVPFGSLESPARALGAEIIRLWREGVRVIVVNDRKEPL